jgi:sterol desaturase/sphingolipid hydroxylase (fatty acid hydroxylase superfamily)
MSRKALLDFALSPYVFFPLLLLIRAIFFTTLESVRPARPVPVQNVIWRDFAALLAYVYLIFPVAGYLNHRVHGYHSYSASVAHLPLLVRVALYFIVADFGHYWVHRLVHTRYLWRVHKWHHSPTYMYWLGGVRATVPQQFLVNIPYIVAYPFLDISPWWLGVAIIVMNAAQNDWMHLNFTWKSSWLEWILVTPRYHHIHHSDDPRHYVANLGNLLTVWDRLFGTYVDPETVQEPIAFGIGAKENPLRLVLGI